MAAAVAIGSDEAGFALKAQLAEVIRSEGFEVVDFGCHSTDPVTTRTSRLTWRRPWHAASTIAGC
jgi:ribose 5-phosphate isomerase RpiB